MLFSARNGVSLSSSDDWFDPILDTDTKLFIDPFLVFVHPKPPFNTAHGRIVDFFDKAFQLAAQTRGNLTGLRYRKLLNILTFPEPRELCLGYTELGTAGSGSGRRFSSVI